MRKKKVNRAKKAWIAAAVFWAAGSAKLAFAQDDDFASDTYSGGSDDFSDPNAWFTTIIPTQGQSVPYPSNGNGGYNFDIYIPVGTLTVDVNPTVNDCYFYGGSLLGNDTNLSIVNTFNWSGGIIGSGGTGPTITTFGNVNIAGNVSLYGGELDIKNLANWTSGTINASSSLANITLEANATMNIQGGVLTTYATSFLNGTVNVNASGSAVFAGSLSSNGLLNLNGGNLTLSGVANVTSTWTLNANTNLNISNLFNMSGSATCVGGGTIQAMSGGFINWSSSAACNASLNLSAGSTFNAATNVVVNAGSVQASGLLNIAVPNDSLTFNVPVTFKNGTMNGGLGAQYNFSDGLIVGGNVTFGKGINALLYATIHQFNQTNPPASPSDSYWSSGSISCGGGTVFNVASGATFTATLSNGIYSGNSQNSSNPDLLNNAGTFINASPAGTTNVFYAGFNSSGTVVVQSGTLLLEGGGQQSGPFNIASGATLQIGGTPETLNNGCSINGAGTLLIGYAPGENGTLVIPSGVSIPSSTLVLSQFGQVTGSGVLNLTGNASFTGGALNGPSLNNSGALTIASTLSSALNFYAGTINNVGTTTWSSSTILCNGSTVFNNLVGATFTANVSNGTYSGHPAGYSSSDFFNNAGTFINASPVGTTTTIGAGFNNSGTVIVQSGTLLLEGGGQESGSFNIASGANLQILGTSVTFGSGCTFTGQGAVEIGTASGSGATGTLVVPAGIAVSIPSLVFLGSFAGQLAGAGAIQITGYANLSGGSIDGPTLNNSGHLNIVPSGSYTLNFDAGVINNTGNAVWSLGGISCNGSTVFNNLVDGTFTANGSNGTYNGRTAGYSTSDWFNNAGTFINASPAGTTTLFSAGFNNSGSVIVQSGTLLLEGGGQENGSFTIASGASLQILGPSVDFSNGGVVVGAGMLVVGSTSSGQGILSIANGVVVNVPNLTLNGNSYNLGQLAGSGTLNATGNATITAGEVNGPTLNSTGVLNIASNTSTALYFFGGIINNSGTATWGTGNVYCTGGTVFNNLVSGTFTANLSNGTYQGHQGPTTPDLFNNAGTFINASPAGSTTTFQSQFNNSGTVIVQSGTLALGYVGQLSSNTLTGGIWEVGGNCNLSLGAAVSVNKATIELTGPGATIQSLSLSDNQGSFALYGGSVYSSPANLSNESQITIGRGSKLTVNGSLSFSSGGSVDCSGTLSIANANLGQLTALLREGFDAGTGGSWDGGGIDSSSAEADPNHLTAVGMAPFGSGGTILEYTYYGDANLDGVVDGSDYSRIDSGYLTQATGWFNGDFNYDGIINGSDYTLIDNAFNRQGAAITAELSHTTAEVANSAGAAAVPEPALGMVAVVFAAGLLGRRRGSVQRGSLSPSQHVHLS